MHIFSLLAGASRGGNDALPRLELCCLPGSSVTFHTVTFHTVTCWLSVALRWPHIRLRRDGEPGTATGTFTQPLSCESRAGTSIPKCLGCRDLTAVDEARRRTYYFNFVCISQLDTADAEINIPLCQEPRVFNASLF